METEEQIRQYKYATAESFASLSIGLWTAAIIGYLTSGIPWMTYSLAIVGIISALFSGYLIVCWDWKQKSVIEFLKTHEIISIVKLLVWYIVLWIFGAALIQTKAIWLIVIGIISIIIAVIVFPFGLWLTKKGNRKKKITGGK